MLQQREAHNSSVVLSSLRVVDALGRTIPVNACSDAGRLEWSVANWAPGIYSVSFVADKSGLLHCLRLVVD